MVVDDFHVLRAGFGPAEAEAELVVDPDTVLTGAIAVHCFQAVRRRHAQVGQDLRRFPLFMRLSTCIVSQGDFCR
jgi:hypothetical protein